MYIVQVYGVGRPNLLLAIIATHNGRKHEVSSVASLRRERIFVQIKYPCSGKARSASTDVRGIDYTNKSMSCTA